VSIETDLVNAISSTFSGRVYPDTAPASTPRPFCVYQTVGGVPVNNFCGDALQHNSRIEVWVWADTRQVANEKMRAIGALLTAAPLRGTATGNFMTQYDEVTRYYGAMQHFSFWA
jgi:hypothetical protein